MMFDFRGPTVFYKRPIMFDFCSVDLPSLLTTCKQELLGMGRGTRPHGPPGPGRRPVSSWIFSSYVGRREAGDNQDAELTL